MSAYFLEQLKAIKTVILDVDGVLTDGSIWLTADGEMVRSMNVKDGYALQLAVKQGYHMAIISGGTSQPVKVRLEKLGIKEVHIGIHNKLEVFEGLLKTFGVSANEVLYLGDDIPDFEVMQRCGLNACPADAVQEIKELANYISPAKGGEAFVRDVLEKLMRVQGKWFASTLDNQFKW